jgi:dipeptidyl aminopeptidase/acylaminoacyl peptidase
MSRLLRQCLLALLCAAIVAPAAAQEVAGPSAEYQGELPPLIDRQKFFGDPQYSNAQLSPDGQHVTFLKPYKGKMNVWVKGVDEPFSAAEPVTADTTRPVPFYFWTQDSERILWVQDRGGNENFHIYAANPDAETETDLGVPPAEDLTPYEDVRAQIIDVPENTPGEIIVGLNDRNPKYHDVYRLDLETGERTLLYKNDKRIAGWETDLDGDLRLATRQTSDGGTEILRVEEDTLVSVYECSFEESCSPVRFHKDGKRVYMSTNKGEDVDLQRLVLFNPKTQATEVVASDPEGEVDFGGAIFNDRTEELAATVYVDERQRVYPKTESFEQKYQALKQKLPDGELSIQSSTEDYRTHVVSVEQDVNPGATYLFDSESGAVEKLYESRPELPSKHLAEMRPITYEARDGLEIPAYLTLPKGVEHEDLPTIIFPHGGPWARDTWGYNSFAQFFANRGYAVLQPNFRGSTGYGKDFLNAGNKEWGTGAMQHDLTDGVQYLIDQGIAAPDRVGITGISYGGYATLAGLTFTPDVYAAGASYVGPSNLITLLNSIPPYWAPVKKMFHRRMGNPNTAAGKKQLKKQSPFFHADNIDDPLLVIQGANDPRVKKQESDQIVVAARESDVPVQYLVAPEEGHGFRKENNELAVAAQLERFFGEHLGGRYQTGAAPAVRKRLAALTVDPDSVTLPDTTKTTAQSGTKGVSMVDGSTLQSATLDYDVTMKAKGRSIDLSSTRTIRSTSADGNATWTVVSTTETPRATVTDSLILDRSTLRPRARHLRGPMTMNVTYTDTSASGEMTVRGRTMSIEKGLKQPTLAGGSNNMLALAAMPLSSDFSTSLSVFNERRRKVRTQTFTVTGTKTVKTPAGTFETHVVEMNVKENGTSGTMYLRKTAPHHVVKTRIEQSGPQGSRTIIQTLSSMTTPTSSSAQ